MGGRGARGPVVAELSRREFIGRASAVGVGMLVAGALPVARAHALLGVPAPIDPDPTLQAFADTILPGRKVRQDRPRQRGRTRSRSPASTRCPARSRPTPCALFHHPLIGFDALEPALLADLSARSLALGGRLPRLCLRQAGGGAARAGSTSTTRRASCGRPPPRSRSRPSAPPR